MRRKKYIQDISPIELTGMVIGHIHFKIDDQEVIFYSPNCNLGSIKKTY